MLGSLLTVSIFQVDAAREISLSAVAEDLSMSQPVFSLGLEEDTVQRVGTKLCLEVEVEESPEKVFFEWRGPTGSNADDGRVKITESGRSSTAEITPLHLQV